MGSDVGTTLDLPLPPRFLSSSIMLNSRMGVLKCVVAETVLLKGDGSLLECSWNNGAQMGLPSPLPALKADSSSSQCVCLAGA